MNTLARHEICEIEALDYLKRGGMLEPLVFGGGTMLRLCYELNRYSADLDLWFVKEVDTDTYFKKLKEFLDKEYELTDAQIKSYTLLFEVRSKDYPRRLKIEIRKEMKDCDFQDRIAFSPFSSKQVVLRVHTLEQTMKNKVQAALERKDIRDCFDIEFLLRKGTPLGASPGELERLELLAATFKAKDYKVTLGSVLDPDTRKYYVENGFSYLLEKIVEANVGNG